MRSLITLILLATSALAGEPDYSWRTHATDPDRIYLYREGTQVGGWCYREKHYRPYDGANWGTPTATPPVKPPANRVVVVPQPAPMVITPQVVPTRPLRGPLRVRLGTELGIALADMTTHMMLDVVPAAIADSIKKGNFQLKVQGSASRPGQTAEPPKP